MQNLLSTLSQGLQNQLKDYVVTLVLVDEFNEVRVISDYDMDPSFYDAIEAEVRANQKEADLSEDLTPGQKAAFKEMGQLLMNSLNISKEEALNKIIAIFEDMKKSLDEGVLADHQLAPVKEEAEIVRFEVGNIYEMGFITDADLKVPYICTKRTAKTVTLEKTNSSKGEKLTRKIKVYGGVEYIVSGTYSMAPSVHADKVIG